MLLPVIDCALLIITSFAQLAIAARNGTYRHNPKRIIIDTDIMTDVDDVGALAVANTLHNCGLCDLRAVMINTNSQYGALAASVINTYYGHGYIPIAARRPLTNETFFDRRTFLLGDFASKIAYNWPREMESVDEADIPVDLYRDVLEHAEDASITIISIGFLTNLADLLESPHGPDLIKAKVKELVVMGGRYPSGWEYNFGGHDPASTRRVIDSWPRSVPVTYSGYELGKTILSGQHLGEHALKDSPVLAAYQWYNGRCRTTRESWDPLTVLYGVLDLHGMLELDGIFGLDDLSAPKMKAPFAYANTHGYNSITSADGSNAWVNDEAVTNQHWLKLADGVSNESVAALLTSFYAHDPWSTSCLGLQNEILAGGPAAAGPAQVLMQG